MDINPQKNRIMPKYEVTGVLKQKTETLEMLQSCCQYELEHFDTLKVSTDDVTRLTVLHNEVCAELIIRKANHILNHKK